MGILPTCIYLFTTCVAGDCEGQRVSWELCYRKFLEAMQAQDLGPLKEKAVL